MRSLAADQIAVMRRVADDEADRGRARLTASVPALWGAGRAVDCGHFLPQEAPEEIVEELRRFLAEHPGA